MRKGGRRNRKEGRDSWRAHYLRLCRECDSECLLPVSNKQVEEHLLLSDRREKSNCNQCGYVCKGKTYITHIW